jgi:TusA-related sulfurtransferase
MMTTKKLREMVEGERLVIHATDPLAVIDIPHAVNEAGGLLIGVNNPHGFHTFNVIKDSSRVVTDKHKS